jgi:CRISPR/Cas system-associated endoribonuclease Cas2
MITHTESGTNAYVDNFAKLISECKGMETLYNPRRNDLTIGSLEIMLDNVKGSIIAVNDALGPYLIAENRRKTAFSILASISTRVQAAAIVLELPESMVVRIKEVVRKIKGQRARKIKDDATEEEQKKHISVSQRSYGEQIEHLNLLISLLKSAPEYDPAEMDIAIPALDTLLNQMQMTNSEVIDAATPLANARKKRDELLYTPKTGMMSIALSVKEYVKSAFGVSSTQYKAIKGIPFRNKKIQ